jgi:aryl-alcohol dehydrogenase-like predicted oxidoreductase
MEKRIFGKTGLSVTREQNVGVIAKRPIANSAWRPAQQHQGIYQEYSAPYRERFTAMKISPQDLGFSGAADWPEIALRFTLSHPGVHVAIAGTTNPVNARRNLDYAVKGPLAKAALEKLQSAFQRAAASGRENWAGLT